MRKVKKIFRALGDINRIRVLKLLQEDRVCVCELAAVLGISQPSISRHLKKLISAGLIAGEQQGYWTSYFIAPANEASRIVLECLQAWLSDDNVVQTDRDKLKALRRCRNQNVTKGDRHGKERKESRPVPDYMFF